MGCLSDGELIGKVRAGDVDSFGQLVERYQGLVFGVAFHMLGHVEDARDVSQDAFIRAFTRLDKSASLRGSDLGFGRSLRMNAALGREGSST